MTKAFLFAATVAVFGRGGVCQSVVTKDLGSGDAIQWHLQGSGWQVGQFVNGDWWVVVPFGQTLTVTGTTFTAASPTVPVPYTYVPNSFQVGANWLPLVRSGSMKNPRSTEAVAFTNIYENSGFGTLPFGAGSTFIGPSPTGYDSRSGWFHPSFVTPLPVTLQAWDVLVTAISQPDSTNRPDYDPGTWTSRGVGWSTHFNSSGGDATSTTRLASVLTVLPEVPPGTVSGQSPYMRPPYGGDPADRALWSGGVTSGSQPSSYLSAWAWDPAQFLGRTPSVVRPGNIYSPVASGVLEFWRGTFLDHLQHENCGTFLAPSDATPTYGRDQMAMIGTTALMLCEAPSGQMSPTEREALLVPFLQFGIDCYGMVKDGRRFNGSGGHSGGRKWPLLYAGIVMDNPGMRSEAGPHMTSFGNRWKEDAQCLTAVDVNGNVVPDWQGLLYRWRVADGDPIDYQNEAPSSPSAGWTYLQCRAENYRVCCTIPAYVYFDLCCRLMENHPAAAAVASAMQAWGNDAFFGCVDRFMLPMTPEVCAEYDYMEVIRQNEITACMSQFPPPPPGACDLETIEGHYSGWGRSVGILYQSAYGQGMWRTFRWQNHQRGISIVGPAGFAGAQPYCQFGPQLDELRCQTPAERAVNPAPRSLPTLVTEQPAAMDTTMRFEVHSVPPDSVLSVYVAGNPASLGLLNPSMPCSCVSPATSLCGAPLFVDYPNAALLTLVSTNYTYRNLNFELHLPPVIGSFAIQAVMMPLDLSNFVSTNAYSISTY